MKEADPSSEKHVGCPSETDSLKRLTCYDNLPDNLKNKDCSSISDSLKRLSCFETEKKIEVAEEKMGGTASTEGCEHLPPSLRKKCYVGLGNEFK